MKHGFRFWFMGMTMICAMMSLTAATFAWFTSNRAVSTSTVTARTGEETLELQISTNGSSFSAATAVDIQQVNQTNAEYLMPVSTDDLVNFVYSAYTVHTDDGQDVAMSFEPVGSDEPYYYHGRVYLRAVANGWPSDTRLNLYLDQSDGVIFGTNLNDGRMLSAVRLGLVFDNDKNSTVILRLTEEENSSGQILNTVVNGKRLGKDQVLHSSGSSQVTPVTDPSHPITDYEMTFTATDMSVPQNALITMDLNRTYQVDIYVYLEGCDPDCSNAISFDASEIQLGFYGAVSQGGEH